MAALQGAPALVQLGGGDVTANIPAQTPLQHSTSDITKHFWVSGSGFPWKNWRVGAASGVQWVCHSQHVLSVYEAGLELETWPIQDECSIGTRSSASVFHSRHLLLLIHNIYWYKKLMEDSASCLCQPRSELWLDHTRAWVKAENGLYSVLSWTACLAGLRMQQCLPWTQERTAQYWGRAVITLVLLRVQKQLFPLGLTRKCNALPRHLFTSSSLLLFSPISRSFWGQVS